MPKLSILVPTYNRAAYLRECVDSLLATTVDCEIVVSDNASTDETEAVMAAYTDARIRYFRQETNTGGLNNYNFLLAQARGEYICLFGDDDRALPGCFERKVALLEDFEHVDMVYSLAHIIDPDGRPLTPGKVMGHLEHSYMGGRDDFSDLLLNCYISWQTLVFRREVYDTIGPLQEWGLKASIDWYWLQQAVRGRTLAFFRDRTVEVRNHPGSYSASVAHKEGYFLKDRLVMWRRWLLESGDPPTVTEIMWERMVRIIRLEVRSVHGDEPGAEDAYLLELGRIHQAYLSRMERRFQASLELPAFQPGLAPWALEDRKRLAFLHLPNWCSPAWKEVLISYCQAFTPEEEVTLVLWSDPAQGLSPEYAYTQVLSALRDAGINPDHCPDLLLVPDALGQEELARLFSAVDWVLPQGDAIDAERARRVGKPCLEKPAPDAWRAALARASGAPA